VAVTTAPPLLALLLLPAPCPWRPFLIVWAAIQMHASEKQFDVKEGLLWALFWGAACAVLELHTTMGAGFGAVGAAAVVRA